MSNYEGVTSSLKSLSLNPITGSPSDQPPFAPSLPPVTTSWSSASLPSGSKDDGLQAELSHLATWRLRKRLLEDAAVRRVICKLLSEHWDKYKDTSRAETRSIASSRHSKTKSLKATPQKDKKGGGRGAQASGDRFYLWLSSAYVAYCVVTGEISPSAVQTCHVMAPR
jgi:hypothetical protein